VELLAVARKICKLEIFLVDPVGSRFGNKKGLAFCVGVFLVRGCSVGIYPLGADSSLETREGRYR
jgi:hypothetical protein